MPSVARGDIVITLLARKLVIRSNNGSAVIADGGYASAWATANPMATLSSWITPDYEIAVRVDPAGQASASEPVAHPLLQMLLRDNGAITVTKVEVA
jgi:hypothetical protein